VKLARSAPLGPAWISKNVWEEDAPGPVTVMITRRLPGRRFAAAVVHVDRTCLGVKHALVLEPLSEQEIGERAASMGEKRVPLARCEPEFAQSVVFHAVSYARARGFEPHRDFEPGLFEPYPTPLIDTPLAKPRRPLYIPEPGDDAEEVLGVIGQLDARVGRENYDLIYPRDALEWIIAEREGDGAEGDDEEGVFPREYSRPGPADVIGEFDLDTDEGLANAVDVLVDLLSKGEYLAWEAVARETQGLELTTAQAAALRNLFDPDSDDSLEYIEYAPPPHEPWYETVRRVAPRLVVDRFETWRSDSINGDLARRGIELLDAVERFGRDLSLPDGCTTVRDLLPAKLWHRLRVQNAFDVLSGIGRLEAGKRVTLEDPAHSHLIGLFVEVLGEHAEDLAALEWTIDDVLGVVILPARDRALLLNELRGVRVG